MKNMKLFLLVVGIITFNGKATAKSSAKDGYVLVDGKRIAESIIEQKPISILSRKKLGFPDDKRPKCWKIKVIIYYDKDFLDGWVAAGTMPVIPRIHSIMDLVKDGIFNFYGLHVQFDIEAIEYYKGSYEAGDYGFLRNTVVNNDIRNPDAWIFLAYDGNTSGHVGTAGGAFCSKCKNTVPVIVTEAHDYSGGNSDKAWIGFMRYFFGYFLWNYPVTDPEKCLEKCCVPCEDWKTDQCKKWKLNGQCENSLIQFLCCLTCKVY